MTICMRLACHTCVSSRRALPAVPVSGPAPALQLASTLRCRRPRLLCIALFSSASVSCKAKAQVFH